MGLPLQPDLRPAPRWRRVGLGLALVVLVVAVVALVPARPEPSRLILSRPDRPLEASAALDRHVADARRRLWLMFYVVRMDTQGPVGALLEGCARAAAAGVDVRIVLDRAADADGQRNAEAAAWCASHGIRVVWDEVGVTTHAKVVLTEEAVWIGSHNATRAALAINREAAVILADPAALAATEAWFRAVPGFDP